MSRVDRPEIVAEARTWLGTPYRHQARCRGAGCDCLGLILGLWEACIGPLPALPPAYTADWSEASGQERLWHAAGRHLVPVPLPEARAGDVLLFRMREGAVAKHLGVQSGLGPEAAFIHAYSRRGVVESRLTAPWAPHLVARFAFPQGH